MRVDGNKKGVFTRDRRPKAAAHLLRRRWRGRLTRRGAERLRSSRQYLGYAGGDVANNLTFSMASAFLLIYYTDVAGHLAPRPPARCSSSSASGAASPTSFAGRRVDETSTRWGKFRPYLLFASAPLLLLLVALFSIPERAERRRQGRLGLRLLRAVLAGLQLREHPLRVAGGGDDPGARRAGEAVDGTDGGRQPDHPPRSPSSSRPRSPGPSDLQRSLTITTVVFAVIGFALYLWCFATARETVAARRRQGEPARHRRA